MSFLTIEFLIFFFLLLIILKFTKEIKRYHIVLLTASYVFYALGDIKFLILLVAVSVLMWHLGLKIQDSLEAERGKKYLILGVGIDLVVLGIFKYFNFFAGSFGKLLGKDFVLLKIILPVGISFYIFQAISYIADVYLKKIQAEKSMLNVLLYIGFFPQIVSGPIVKARDFLPQLRKMQQITLQRFSWGLQRFVLGLFKKVVIADRLGLAVDAVYATPMAYSGLSLLVAVLSYALQIYYDFSGYSDMAIGIAHILGFDLGKNFNLPYLAKNPSDFWRRWHISLSSWFKEYVYIPLGGSKKGMQRTYLNLFITMLLSGLWHGASWAFVIWGILHAVISVLHKGFSNICAKKNLNHPENKFGSMLSVILTFLFVMILWIPFRVNDLGSALLILQRIVTWSPGVHYVYVFTVIFTALLLVVEIVAVVKNNKNDIWMPLDLSRFWAKVVFCLFCLLIVCFAYIGEGAFIYAQF